MSLGGDTAELRRLWESGQRSQAIRGALDSWNALLAGQDDLRWLEPAMRACGLPIEATALQLRSVRRQRASRGEWERLISSVLQSGDPWWARELLHEMGGGSRALEALRIEAELAAANDAVAALITDWLQHHHDDASREAAVGWWVRSGRVDEAERLVKESPASTVWRARFALWRDQPKVALALVKDLPPSAEVRCLEAVAAVLEGRLSEAESLLRALLESEVRAEAWSWLATVLRQQKCHAEAVQAADAASLASPVFMLATQLERELSANVPSSSTLTRLLQFIGFRIRTVSKLEYADLLYPLGLKPEDPIETLQKVLERFAGNHTANLTTVDQGTLASHPLPPHPRYLAASIQVVLWTRGIEAARALYRELAPRVHGHPLFRIYQGELELWVGAYEEAARIFQEALARDPRVKWAWIGLGASAMLQGDLREAQKIWAKGISVTDFAGPSLYVYRGECYRRQGEVARARRDLEVALRQKPERISARINLALLDGERDTLERAERECVALAPLLMDELSGSTAEKLEKVLEAMRGNRSSSPWRQSYHLWGRVWRRPS